jgi:uncharacterized membrane protein
MALVLMLCIVAVAAVLAIAQDALPLAMLGAAGGFLAPILTSSGDGNYQSLLAYYVVLNLGILALAFVKTWRPLNLLGLAFTFLFQLVPLRLAYTPEHYWQVAPYLWTFFAMYVGIAVLYARHRSLALLHYVDGPLVFATPLATFALQGMLLRGTTHGLAYASATLGLLYLVLAALLGRRTIVPSMRLLAQAFLAVGITFLTVAVPLYFDARETSSLWALEGAAIAWLAVRQQRLTGQLFGVLLQALAGIAFVVAEPWSRPVSELVPILNSTCLGFVVLATAAFTVSRALLRSSQPELARSGPPAVFWVGIAWATACVFNETHHFVPAGDRVATNLACLSLGAAALLLVRRRLDWPVALQPVFGLWPAMMVAVVLAATSHRGHAFAHGGFIAWVLAFGIQLRFLDVLARERGHVTDAAPALHVGTYLLGVALLAHESAWTIGHTLHQPWQLVPAAILGVAAAALITLVTSVRAGRWPFRLQPMAYLGPTSAVLIAIVALTAVLTNLLGDGDVPMRWYVPLLNPVDATNVLGLLALAIWQREARSAHANSFISRRGAYAAWGVLAFVVANGALLRALHRWFGTPYGRGMFHSTTLQAVITVFWTGLAIGAMVYATRRSNRAVWLAGAALLGVVVVKLFFLDLAALEGLQRIVAFLGVGIMLLAIGYFSPVPPKAASPVEEERSAV